MCCLYCRVYRLYDLGSLRLMYCISTDQVKDVQMGRKHLVLHLSGGDAGLKDTDTCEPGRSEPDRSGADGAGSHIAHEEGSVVLRVLSAPNRKVSCCHEVEHEVPKFI
jgi:hypothetical protein